MSDETCGQCKHLMVGSGHGSIYNNALRATTYRCAKSPSGYFSEHHKACPAQRDKAHSLFEAKEDASTGPATKSPPPESEETILKQELDSLRHRLVEVNAANAEMDKKLDTFRFEANNFAEERERHEAFCMIVALHIFEQESTGRKYKACHETNTFQGLKAALHEWLEAQT